MNTQKMYTRIFLGGAATLTVYYMPLLPHTVLLDKYKSYIARYTFNLSQELPVEETIRKRFQEVMDDLKLEPDIRELIKPFSVFGFDPYHIGTCHKPYGGYIGLPSNFDYFDIDYVNKDNILIDGQQVDWSQKNAMMFANSLVLSEDAQKYGIAREILKLQQDEPLRDAIVAAAIVMFSYILYNITYYEFQLPKARPLYRRIIVSFVCLFGIGCWIAIKDSNSCKCDADIDNSLSELGSKYIKGGKEFYEKLLQRNIALRSILGTSGEKAIAANGNENTMFRRKHMPFSHRKSFFELKLQNIQQSV